MKPILKWAGGKKDHLEKLKRIITPERLRGHTYIEPFVGGGALAFDLEHTPTIINDFNSELMNVYFVIREMPNDLIRLLKEHAGRHAKDSNYYYSIRNIDRNRYLFEDWTPLQKAARTIYLNKTCFNGLYRVNKQGLFNCPLGRLATGKLPDIVMEDKILELSDFLQTVYIKTGDYRKTTALAKPGDVLYLDPPYDYEDKHNFVGYNADGFSTEDLEALAAECNRLVALGCLVVVSNNDTTDVRRVFAGWTLEELEARRSITPKSTGRSGAKEVIIYK